MKLFKSSPSKLGALLFSAAVLGLASQNASALTGAGTSIANTATLTYSIGGTAQTAIPSSPTGNTAAGGAGGGVPTTFLVDRKIDFTLTGGNATSVTAVGVNPGQLQNAAVTPTTALQYTLTNVGNAPQSFVLNPASVAGNTFAPGTFTVYVQTGAAGPFNPATAIPVVANVAGPNVPAGFPIKDLGAGVSQTVFVLSNIPNVTPGGTSLLNGNQALVNLTAQATVPTLFAGAVVGAPTPNLVAGALEVQSAPGAGANATGGANVNVVDVVFANVATPAIAANATAIVATPAVPAIAANTGTASAVGVYKIQSAAVVVKKTSSVICDPVNGTANPMNIPLAAVQYAITVWNPTTDANGIAVTTPATLTNVVDTLVAQLAYDPNKVTGAVAPAAALCTGSPANAASAGGLGYVMGYSTTAPAVAAGPATAAPAGTLTPVPVATPGGTVTIVPSVILAAGSAAAAGSPAGTAPRVAAGDLLPGEYITFFFNAFIQ